MRYVIYNDFFKFLYKNIKLLFYILFIFLVFLLEKIIGYELDTQLFIDCMGLNLDFLGNYLANLSFFLNVLFFSYLAIFLFTNDMQNNIENIFLRIKPNKYLNIKYFSIICITSLIKVVTYLLALCFYLVNHSNINDIIILFVKDFIYITSIQYFILSLYMFSKKSMLLSITLLFIIVIIINILGFNIPSIDLRVLFLVAIIFNLIIKCFFRNNYNLLHE